MTKKRGFASMDAAKQREIASKGGKAAHQKGTAHQFTPEEARAAGRKGGQAAHFKGTAHKFTSEEARAAGRKGGRSARNAVAMNPAATSTPAPDHEPNREGPSETPATNASGSFAPRTTPEANANPPYTPAGSPAPSPGPVNSPA
jgi:general stress protein YciG